MSRVHPDVFAELKSIDDLLAPLLGDPQAAHLRAIAKHVQQARGLLGNQDWEAFEKNGKTAGETLRHVVGMLHSEIEQTSVRLFATTDDLAEAAEVAGDAINACRLDVESYWTRSREARVAGTLAAQHAVDTVHIAGYMQGLTFALGQLEKDQKEAEDGSEAAE